VIFIILGYFLKFLKDFCRYREYLGHDRLFFLRSCRINSFEHTCFILGLSLILDDCLKLMYVSSDHNIAHVPRFFLVLHLHLDLLLES